jgi:hypothetical protein
MFIIMSVLEFFSFTKVLTQNFNSADLVRFLERNKKLHLQIVAITSKMTSCRTMNKKKKQRNKILWIKQTSFLAPCPLALGQFQPHGCM